MRTAYQLQDEARSAPLQFGRAHLGMSVIAAAVLAVMIMVFVIFWPIPYTGMTIDIVTGTVLEVEPNTMAERAGVEAGDQILRIYGYAWEDIDRQLFLFPLAWHTVQTIPVDVERSGTRSSLVMPAESPALAFQLEKVTALLLGLIYWLTGYLLGVVRRHENQGTPLIAWFWMVVGLVVGCYTFVLYSSYLLTVVLQWLLLAVIAPVSIYVHVWFPPRPVTPHTRRRARRWLIISLLGLQAIGLLSLALWQPSLVEAVDLLGMIMPAGLAVSFLFTGVLLWRAYRQMTTAHIRRQIRLIASVCFLVAFCWMVLRSIPVVLDSRILISSYWIDLLSGLVPLAYLVGAAAPDLYRLDRVLARIAVHAITTLVLAIVLIGVTQILALQGPLTALWIAVGFVVLYRPLQQAGLQCFRISRPHESVYAPLASAATALAATLDSTELVRSLCQGVSETFGHPPLGFYLGDIEGSDELSLAYQERLHLPAAIVPCDLTHCLRYLPSVAESRQVHRALAETPLAEDAESLVRHPGIVLWCPIRHSRGFLLGLLVLGMRDDLDPYRAQDVEELQRLLAAGTLALTNSAAYTEQARAEQTIRQLYRRLQQAQDVTAAAIAREIHDEVLNVNLRLNIEALERVLEHVQEPALREELQAVLEGDRTVIQMLRLVCEHIHPLGIDDPLGLPFVLRRQVEKTQRTWSGQCRLVIEQPPCPVDPPIQREVLRIMREALTNAIKHADASEIAVYLIYPGASDSLVRLTIRDNGRGTTRVRPQPGRWGVRNMLESARTAGGSLEFRCPAHGGTEVVFAFAAVTQERDQQGLLVAE